MKRHLSVLVLSALLILAFGCRRNPNAFIQLPQETEYVGSYLEISDVLRIGHALDTVPTRTTIQWENETTGYQFSMMVFTSNTATETVEETQVDTATRKFSVLTITRTGDAEVLNLMGTSSKKNIWNIVAESSAAAVGKAVRMTLAATPVPEATLSSGTRFNGFMVAR